MDGNEFFNGCVLSEIMGNTFCLVSLMRPSCSLHLPYIVLMTHGSIVSVRRMFLLLLKF